MSVRTARLAGAALLIAATPLAGQEADPAQSLAAADRAWSDSTAARGAAGFASRLTTDALYLYPGAPILEGRDAIARFFPGHPRQTMRWQSLRVVVDSGGYSGATFGVLTASDSSATVMGRYIAFWVRGMDWRVSAVMHALPLAGDPPLPATLSFRPDTGGTGSRGQAERADRAFAADAARRGADRAFQAYAAPDAMMFAGTGQLLLGPEEIGAAMGGPATWTWGPVASGAAGGLPTPSNLAYTVGEAEIRAGGRVFPTKYLTIWQRQPDGSWKFITDGGNARPAR